MQLLDIPAVKLKTKIGFRVLQKKNTWRGLDPPPPLKPKSVTLFSRNNVFGTPKFKIAKILKINKISIYNISLTNVYCAYVPSNPC